MAAEPEVAESAANTSIHDPRAARTRTGRFQGRPVPKIDQIYSKKAIRRKRPSNRLGRRGFLKRPRPLRINRHLQPRCPQHPREITRYSGAPHAERPRPRRRRRERRRRPARRPLHPLWPATGPSAPARPGHRERPEPPDPRRAGQHDARHGLVFGRRIRGRSGLPLQQPATVTRRLPTGSRHLRCALQQLPGPAFASRRAQFGLVSCAEVRTALATCAPRFRKAMPGSSSSDPVSPSSEDASPTRCASASDRRPQCRFISAAACS